MGEGLGQRGGPWWALIIAEDFIRGMALFRLVEWAGHRATVVDTRAAAMAMLRAEPFDLVLLDAARPASDGLSIVRQLRGDRGLMLVPLLIVVPEGDNANAAAWIKSGADEVVCEPLVPLLLRVRINACLVRKRLADRGADLRGEIEQNLRRGGIGGGGNPGDDPDGFDRPLGSGPPVR